MPNILLDYYALLTLIPHPGLLITLLLAVNYAFSMYMVATQRNPDTPRAAVFSAIMALTMSVIIDIFMFAFVAFLPFVIVGFAIYSIIKALFFRSKT